MSIMIWGILVSVPFLMGLGICRCLFGKGYWRKYNKGEIYIIGLCGWIGVAECAHVAAVFLHWNIRQMSIFLWGMSMVLSVAAGVWSLWERRKCFWLGQGKGSLGKEHAVSLLSGVLCVSVFFQIILIVTGDISWREGDMMLETVQTFLSDDQAYQTNPLTGQNYVGGIPLRLKILCLPSLYASVCSLTGVDAGWFLYHIWPVVILLGSYLAYGELGKVLFKEDGKSLLLMLVILSVLIWMGDYMVSVDGFGLLHCGYRGTTLRNGILVPFTISVCLKRKWVGAILAILAEACIVWTLYGMGICFLVTVIILVIQFVISHREGARCRNL